MGPQGSGPGEPPVVFHTSGHTGEPVRWLRTPAQLRAEVDLVCDVALGDVDQVVSFAPPEHLFGRLFGRELPVARGIPVVDAWRDPTSPPVVPTGRRTLFVCLPASWVLLRALTDVIGRLPSAVALHGTAPATPAARDVLGILDGTGFRAVEIFGSTEAGGIAVRDLTAAADSSPAWAVLPDVEIVRVGTSDEQLLTVRSPRLAWREHRPAPDQWRSADVVRLVDDRHFHFVGRESRLVKVNGIRCDVAVVELMLSATFPGLDVACVPVVDETRAEHYELYYAGASGAAVSDSLISQAVAGQTDMPVPRRIHRVSSIPRGATGKPLLDRIRAGSGS